MFFDDADQYELSRMGWNKSQVASLKKHVDELYNSHRDDYAEVDNYRFAKVGDKDQEISYRYAVEHRTQGCSAYDRTIVCSDNSKLLYGFDYKSNYRSNYK